MSLRQHAAWITVLSSQVFAQAPKWTPVSLSQELYPIAHLESSWGRNTKHQAHSKGTWNSSFGALGLKAVTAYEAMRSSRRFMSKWSVGTNQTINITERNIFLVLFTTNVKFYNELANIHWQYLKLNTANIEQAVFAWRWGLAATINSENHADDKYVAAYLTK